MPLTDSGSVMETAHHLRTVNPLYLEAEIMAKELSGT